MTQAAPFLPYSARISYCTNNALKRLYIIMEKKRSNLVVSADVTSKDQLLDLADKVGPEICLLKTHIDILSDFDLSLINQLTKLANRHEFLLFEDRKFADIGMTVKHQYLHGLYKIIDWADFVTIHAVAGPGSLVALKSAGIARMRGAFLLIQMSSADHLMTQAYQAKALRWAEQHKDFIAGIIAQERLSHHLACLHLIPGIHLKALDDEFGQQYITPTTAIKKRQMDCIIVGRAIYKTQDPKTAAKHYREIGWQAYTTLLSKLSFQHP